MYFRGKMSSEIIKFVQLVENHACLYNNSLQEYSNKDIIERAWTEIAQQMKWSAAECKEKWRNIRNGFVRSLKPSLSGSSSKMKKKYYLHEAMEFVLPYVKPVQQAEQTGNITLSDFDAHSKEVETLGNSQESSDVVVATTNRTQDTSLHSEHSSSMEKRKKIKEKYSEENNEIEQAVLQYIQEKKENKTQDDSRKMFLLSLLPDVKSLSDGRFRQFKIRSLLMVEELLKEQEQETADQRFIRPQHASTPAPSPNDAPTPTSVIYSTTADDNKNIQ